MAVQTPQAMRLQIVKDGLRLVVKGRTAADSQGDKKREEQKRNGRLHMGAPGGGMAFQEEESEGEPESTRDRQNAERRIEVRAKRLIWLNPLRLRQSLLSIRESRVARGRRIPFGQEPALLAVSWQRVRQTRPAECSSRRKSLSS